jgi:hemerythrin-like domain-containing protein
MLKILESLRPRLARGEVLSGEDWTDIVAFLRVFVDRCHHGKEERVLFPAVMQVADAEARDLIEQLLVEHVDGRRLVAILAAAAGTEPVLPGEGQAESSFDAAAADEAIAGYISLIRPHIVHEEKQLFPVADRVLAPEIQQTMQGEYDLIEQEAIGAGRHEAFEQTVERLKERYPI